MAAAAVKEGIKKVSGRIAYIKYSKDDWGVIVVSTASGPDLTCVGDFCGVKKGDTLDFYGTYQDHERFGRQFKVVSFSPAMPRDMTDRDGVIAYMTRNIKGIGKKTAERIWEEFGEDTMDVLENESSKLICIKGINGAKAAEIGKQVSENSGKEGTAYLDGQICARFGVGYAAAEKLRQRYGPDVITIVEADPYCVTEMEGFGFRKADKIARTVGVPEDSAPRIRAAIIYALVESEQEGHTRLPHDELVNRTLKLLDTPYVTAQDVYGELTPLSEKRRILSFGIPGTGWACHPRMARAEYLTAEKLRRLAGARDVDTGRASMLMEAAEEACGVKLNEQQEDAVMQALSNGVSVITGGPGTGKTTVINELIRCLEDGGSKVLLCAPTGRAAKRMGDASGRDAMTIHRALEFVPYVGKDDEEAADGNAAGKFSRNAANPLEQDTIIVDETSMVDAPLAASLFDAVKDGSRVVLVGDADQLPSVGPGSVFRDIIAAGLFPVTRLHAVYRQDEKSTIVRNAVMINEGKVPDLRNDPEGDFFCYSCGTDADAARLVKDIVSGGCPKLGLKAEDIQVLCPMRKGEAGVDALNVMLREALNPKGRKEELVRGERIYREGDRVMQVKNNYKMEWVNTKNGLETGTGVYNGDVGYITAVNPEKGILNVQFDDGRSSRYEKDTIDQLEPAWAVTIHKSQGSEYPAVVIPLLWGPPSLMTRGLLYTAVTRARKYVFIIGKSRTFCSMVKNNFERKRYTGLVGMLKETDFFYRYIEERSRKKKKSGKKAPVKKHKAWDGTVEGQEELDLG